MRIAKILILAGALIFALVACTETAPRRRPHPGGVTPGQKAKAECLAPAEWQWRGDQLVCAVPAQAVAPVRRSYLETYGRVRGMAFRVITVQ